MEKYHLLAVHIVAVISWFAALFYLVRLYIYHVEAKDKPQAEYEILHRQFQIMERRLWAGICQPAMILTVVTGIWLVEVSMRSWQGGWLVFGWFQLKALLLVGLLWYHFDLNRIRKQLIAENYQGSSKFLRFWNEVATILMFGIVGAAFLKFKTWNDLWAMHYYAFMGGFALFALVVGIFFRKALQGKKASDPT